MFLASFVLAQIATTCPSMFVTMLNHYTVILFPNCTHLRFVCTPSRCFVSGIRLFYVDRNWQLKSRLLAVRQFNPTTETLESHRVSALLQSYLESVLEEYDLDVSMIFSATSDAGSDVKRLCDVLLPSLWEWCVCHMLNCSLVEVGLDIWNT